MSVRGKLTLIAMASTSVALVVASVAAKIYDEFDTRTRIYQEAVIRAKIIANMSVTPLAFGNSRAIQEMLAARYLDPHLRVAAVYDKDGVLFAWYGSHDSSSPPRLLPPVPTDGFKKDGLEVFRPITLNGQRIGTVFLQTNLDMLRARRIHNVLVSLAVMAVAAGIAFLLSRRLQRVVLQPILDLAAAARTVATEKNYSVRVTKSAPDELGQLVDGFNEMLGQIEARDLALQKAHSELEARVADRTRDLSRANMLLKTEAEAHRQAREESEVLRQELQTTCEQLQREAEERAQVQEALRRSEERFSKAFRASPVPLAIITRRSRAFVDVNDRFAELAGRKRDEIVGSSLFDLPLLSVPETRARLEQLLADGQPLRNWECSIAGARGQTLPAVLSSESFLLGGETCLLLMVEDISERVNLETQLRQVQKMDAIGQLASGVAHDFNNLLTIIQGYTQLVLARQPCCEATHEALQKVITATSRAAQLTRQLLTFSRKQLAQPKTLDLNQVVNDVIAMLKPLLGEGVRLRWQPAADLYAIKADASMIEQVLVNLAVNARDAMPHGGDLIISTFNCEIDSGYRRYRPQAREGRFVCLQVTDSGCGMDAATLEHLFEPFFTTKGVGKGTGLGLATVYGIVKQHHGWIEVASQVNVGTTFKIFLPAIVAHAGQSEPAADSAAVRGGNETILVVEDEPALRELVTHILRDFGYHVLEATHGREALHVWQNAQRKPDLLLTDMMMPEGMNGWELADRLRERCRDLKVVYTSGYSPELFGQHLELNGNSHFLPKPFNPRALAKTVRDCLDN